MTDIQRKKIAIVGTGISGLAAASLLHPHHDITVFEQNDYIGGHSRTVTVNTKDGVIPVDTGFIVFNKRNYPLLTRLFAHLGVPVAKSSMSFGVSVNKGWLEYSTQNPSTLFAQKRNLFRPSFWRMITDILTFNRTAQHYLSKDPSYTMADCLRDTKLGSWFRDYFLLAMGGAIWSTPVSEMLNFPARSFIRFFDNHGLLSVNDHPQWYTVIGGSREYVKRLIHPFESRIHCQRGVTGIHREGGQVWVEDVHGKTEAFDEVVLACHADQALTLLKDTNMKEGEILSGFQYQPNRAVLHSDTSFMPRVRKTWASWIYLSEERKDNSPAVSLTYWMNNLQPLQTDQPLLVTLNPGHEPDPKLVYNDYWFDHPVFDTQAIINQDRIKEIQGQNGLWFCGAYQRYGFHEDGLDSAVAMAELMGISPVW